MASTAFIRVFLSVLFTFGVLSSAEFIVTHSPSYLQFKPTENRLLMSEIPELVKSTYGFALQKDLSWNGVESDSLFKRPEANVIFSVAGLDGKVKFDNSATYHMEVDDVELDSQTVADKILAASEKQTLILDFSANNVYAMQADHPELFKKLAFNWETLQNRIASGKSLLEGYSLGTLNGSKDADLVLLGELHVVTEILNAIEENPTLVRDGSADLFHFKVTGLKKLFKEYGPDSEQVNDAALLLKEFIKKMTGEFRNLYNDNVIIQVVTLPAATVKVNVRKTRSLLQNDNPTFESAINVAVPVDPLYPVIFNIILWMSILIGASVIAVSCGLWNMDPGRDSIIYRMTSQRIKKD